MNEVWLTYDYFVRRDLYMGNPFSKSQVFINRTFKGSLKCQGFCFSFPIHHILKEFF